MAGQEGRDGGAGKTRWLGRKEVVVEQEGQVGTMGRDDGAERMRWWGREGKLVQWDTVVEWI